jgi:riboflavin synthase
LFTGIVRDVGTVVRSSPGELTVASRLAVEARLGDSIAVNGVDLTVMAHDDLTFSANVMPETLRRSTLSQLAPETAVNLEPALRPIDGLSGHIVRGVVEDRATLAAIEPDGDATILRFGCRSSDLLRHMVVKGPVALDGVSLTLIAVGSDAFAVSMVQYTADHTTFGTCRVGAQVNVETDLLARYVAAALAARLDGLSG